MRHFLTKFPLVREEFSVEVQGVALYKMDVLYREGNYEIWRRKKQRIAPNLRNPIDTEYFLVELYKDTVKEVHKELSEAFLDTKTILSELLTKFEELTSETLSEMAWK
jgi:hypothetical protein